VSAFSGVRGLLLLIAIASWCTAATGAPSTADISDAEFRAQVEKFAAAHRRVLMSWGTLPLGGSTQPHRFAALGVELGPDNEPARAAERTGAYLVEATPTKFWLISYPWDATSFHVSDGEGPDGRASGAPPWLVLDETSIQHGLNHNHGKAYVWFGLRDGRLVALADEDENVRREPESIRHEFAKDDKCVKRCPQLGTYKVLGYELLRVVGSASTITTLPTF
jgi:hypothetical protein